MQCRCCQNRSPVLWTQGRLTKQSWDHTCLRRLPQSRNPSSDRRPPLPWGTSPPHSQMPSKWQPNRPTSLCYRQTRRSTYPLTASNQSSHQDPCSMWVIPRPGHLTSTPENNCCTAGAKSERPRAPVTCPTGSRSICALCLATPVCKRDDLAQTWVTIMVAHRRFDNTKSMIRQSQSRSRGGQISSVAQSRSLRLAYLSSHMRMFRQQRCLNPFPNVAKLAP